MKICRFSALLVPFLATTAIAISAPKAGVPSDYPLTTCVVSGEALGEMGPPVEYTHRVAGQPDRTVFFCCKMCIKKFQKDPAKYIGKIDAAARPTPKP